MSKPKQIGKYQIGEMIGKGAIGCVSRGLNIETGMIVAIKQVSIKNIKENQRNSIQSEINLMKKLNHPNIVKYVDFIQTENQLNIILEYIESGSLESIIRKFGPFVESLVALYIKQVLIGLDYLHSQGVVHRDIKGANILTTKDGIIKLADFGVATRLSENEKAQSFVGTPYWMAPELIEMRGHVSTSCDIWSVGQKNLKDFRCTVIELITGNPPYFDLYQYPALFRIVQDDHPPLPDGVSEECRQFLLKCFEKDPTFRIDAKGLLQHEWIHSMVMQAKTDIREVNNNLPEEVAKIIRANIDQNGQTEQFILDKIEFRKSSNQKQDNYLTYIENNDLSPFDMNQMNNSGIERQTSFFQTVIEEHPSNYSEEHSKHHQIDNLRLLKSQHNDKKTNAISKQDNKFYRQLIEMIAVLQNHTDQEAESVVNCLLQLTDSIKDHPKCKFYILQHCGLSVFLELIDNFSDNINYNMIVHAVLQLINQIIENDSEVLQHTCLFGILPYMLKFSLSDYPKEIRVEAAYFLGQMFYSSQTSLHILISSGGLEAITQFLDTNYFENKDLICLSIDCLRIIFDLKLLSSLNLCKILTKYLILQRLVLIIDQIYQDQDENITKYLNKALFLLTNFAKCEDQKIKRQLCDPNIIQILMLFLTNFQDKPEQLFKVIKIFRLIAEEPTILNALENIGIIPKVIELYSQLKYQNEEAQQDLLKILFYLSKLNTARQESIALAGAIPILTGIVKNTSKILRKISIQILAYFVNTSDITRKKMWENGGPMIFLKYFDETNQHPIILDTLTVWLEHDFEKVEQCLSDQICTHNLVKIFQIANKRNFQQIVPIYLKLIVKSDKISLQLGRSSEFLQELVDRLGVHTLKSEYSNPLAIVRKQLLDILLNICLRNGKPKSLLNQYKLYPVILEILKIAQNEHMVILEQIATQLLKLYDYDQ